jgi:hypothetical protein
MVMRGMWRGRGLISIRQFLVTVFFDTPNGTEKLYMMIREREYILELDNIHKV